MREGCRHDREHPEKPLVLAGASAWHDRLLAHEGRGDGEWLLRALRRHREVPTRVVFGAPAVRRDRRAGATRARLRIALSATTCGQICVELPPTTSAHITPKRSTTWP